MKLLYTAPLDLSKGRSEITHLRELTEALHREGAEVHLLVPAYGRGPTLQGVTVHFAWTWAKTPLGYLFYELWLPFVLVALLLRLRPDVVYCRCGIFTLFPGLVARLFGRPYLIEVNGIYRDEFASRGHSPLIRWAVGLFEQLNYRLASRVICVTPGLRNRLVADYGVDGRRVAVVSNGANTDHFRPLDPAEGRRRLGFGPDDYVAGYVGALAPWHGLTEAVRAIANARDKGLDVKLALVGDGEMRPQVEQLIAELALQDRVRILGYQPYSEVPALIAGFDVALALFKRARNERIGLSPLKLYEYMGCGKPVIATDIAGVTEVVREADCGVLVPAEDPEAVASALEQLSMLALRLQYGANARAGVISRYTWSESARQTLTVCQQAVGR